MFYSIKLSEKKKKKKRHCTLVNSAPKRVSSLLSPTTRGLLTHSFASGCQSAQELPYFCHQHLSEVVPH